jgi:hypothetical protein
MTLPGFAGANCSRARGNPPVQCWKARDRKAAVYDRAMGLFRRKGRKDRREAAAALLNEQTSALKAPAEVPRREVSAEERPDPDQPGWGRTIGQEIGRARENRPSGD